MKNALKVFVFATVLFMFNCGGDDTPPIIPTVSFTHERLIVEPGDDVEFVSTITDGSTFAWDFGDGNTSTEQNPTHTYTETGEFTVTLVVTSTTGDTAQSTSMVTSGHRWLAIWSVESISFTDQNGDPWDDDGTGPEVLFGYVPSSAENIPLFDLGSDLNADSFPLNAGFEEAEQEQLTDENWTFLFLENDEPFDQVNGSSTPMAAFEFNPATQEADEKDHEVGRGIYTIEANGFRFVILYEIRP